MGKEGKNVLLVDDEEFNLVSFKGGYRRYYNVFTAVNVDEAKKILAENDIQVVISDQRMPEITGVEFLEWMVKEYPKAVRMLTTAYSDLPAIIDAINKGNVFRYISKPWEDNDLRIAIDNALHVYHTENLLSERSLDLKRANSKLNDLIINISRNLGNSASNLRNMTEILESLNLNNQGEKAVKEIKQTSIKMNSIVDNMVAYSKNTKLKDVVSPVEFRVIVDETIDFLKKMVIGAERVNFMINVNQPLFFNSDENRLRIILMNLISNAVLFRKMNYDHPKVEIKIQVNSNNAIIIVKDNGIGIIDEFKERIFERFFKVHDSSPGTGLGLSITKEALDKLQGKIEVKSEINRGSTFKVVLPNKK